MSNRFEHLMYLSGLTADGCWDQMDQYDRDAIEKFAELIVKECADLFEIEWGDEKLTGNDVGYILKKHFGVEE